MYRQRDWGEIETGWWVKQCTSGYHVHLLMLLIMASDVSHLCSFESDMKSDNMLWPGLSGLCLLWGTLVVLSNSTTNRLHFNQWTEHLQSLDMVVITCSNEAQVILSLDEDFSFLQVLYKYK